MYALTLTGRRMGRHIRRRLRSRVRRMRKKLNLRRGVALLCGIFLFCGIFAMLSHSLSPAIARFAESSARGMLTECMERATQTVSARDILCLTYDGDGRIASISVDADAMNRYQAGIAAALQEELNRRGTCKMKIPLGSLTDISLLQGRGPRIAVRLTPAGAVRAELQSSFSSGGINQTCHRVDLTVYADITVLMPNGTSETYALSTTLCAAETVIVGEVPTLVRGY